MPDPPSTPEFCDRPSLVTLALVKWPLDMVLGDELLELLRNGRRHRHGVDEVVAGFGEGLAFGRRPASAARPGAAA